MISGISSNFSLQVTKICCFFTDEGNTFLINYNFTIYFINYFAILIFRIAKIFPNITFCSAFENLLTILQATQFLAFLLLTAIIIKQASMVLSLLEREYLLIIPSLIVPLN